MEVELTIGSGGLHIAFRFNMYGTHLILINNQNLLNFGSIYI